MNTAKLSSAAQVFSAKTTASAKKPSNYCRKAAVGLKITEGDNAEGRRSLLAGGFMTALSMTIASSPANAIDIDVSGFKKNVIADMDQARDVDISQTERRAFGNLDVDNTVSRLKKSETYMTKVNDFVSSKDFNNVRAVIRGPLGTSKFDMQALVAAGKLSKSDVSSLWKKIEVMDQAAADKDIDKLSALAGDVVSSYSGILASV